MTLFNNFWSTPKKNTDAKMYPLIDSNFDYDNFMRVGFDARKKEGKPIGSISKTAPKQVAIVGAGIAGLVAAYELARAGVNVTVYEASNRIGGRLFSKPFKNNPLTFCELGAMRFPPSALLFEYYRELAGLNYDPTPFPDPGLVPTKLVYRGRTIDWVPNQPPPEPFNVVNDKFHTMYNKYMAMMDRNNPEYAQNWQKTINKYWNKSFYELLIDEGFTRKDLLPFDALGIGSGGFGPLYPISALEILRIMINGFEENQRLVVDGISSLPEHISERQYEPGKSLVNQGKIIKNARISKVTAKGGTASITTENGEIKKFDAVIFATSNNAMQIAGVQDSLGIPDQPNLTQFAIKNMHNVQSTKIFYRVPTAFWKNSNLPTDIQTDGLLRALYCLQYPKAKDAMVLISYTWEDSSNKLEGLMNLPKDKMLEIVTDELREHVPEFYDALFNAWKDQTGKAGFKADEVSTVVWQQERDQYGAFKLCYPGQDAAADDAFHNFLKVNAGKVDKPIFLAGDAVSYSGGWVIGALETGLNAACGALKHIGGTPRAQSPLTMPRPFKYPSDSGLATTTKRGG